MIEVAKILLNKAKKTEKVPPVDPTEIAKCVADLQLKLMEIKKEHVQVSSGKGTLDERIFSENLRKMKSSMKFTAKKKKTILIFPIGKEEYTYEFSW